ncbi:DUF4011 domain-containing protein [Veillonella agrestimuris]|uniref:DUF4011 domain-containing protein n=1 Tax=Veillonella agrestimuris TaxID=2941340 RepID=UPI00203F79D6|nr:DUF4011 domain-containing protein [Veillonella agrestimuris]
MTEANSNHHELMQESSTTIIDTSNTVVDAATDQGQSITTVEEHVVDLDKEQQVDKKTVWMRNLLDISKRNSLISFKPGPKTIQLMGSSLGALEDALADGKALLLKDQVAEWSGSTDSTTVINVDSQLELVERISEADYKAGQVHTFLTGPELQKRTKDLFRDAKKNIEESGANSLYLALGLLRWIDPKEPKDADGNPPVRYAPLILVPIELVRGTHDQYSMRIREDEPQFNITLVEMLRMSFGLQLHGLNPLPQDESGIDLKGVFSTVRRAVMSMPMWDIVETAFLANFSFSSFVMWNDLRNRFDKLTENKVVSALVNGRYGDYHTEAMDLTRLDEDYKVSDLAIPSSIDSSQLAAVIEASKGVSFVLHGPPGTGKSQTITNMIANALYQGKTVLFVAEKMAALNVVADRLGRIGLGNFCGEIHSSKTQKRVVLDKLQTVLDMKQASQSEEYVRKTNRLQTIKDELNRQMNAIHKLRPQGVSLYDMLALCQQYPAEYRSLRFSTDWLTTMTPTVWDDTMALLRQVKQVVMELRGDVHHHPLQAFTSADYTLTNADSVKTLCDSILSQIEDVKVSMNAVLRSAGDRTTEVGRTIEADGFTMTPAYVELMMRLSNVIDEKSVKTVIDRELWNKLCDADVEQRLAELANLNEHLEALRREVFQDYVDQVETLDLMAIATAVTAGRNGLFSFIMRSKAVRKALAPINALRKGGDVVTDDSWDAELERLQTLQEAKRRVDDLVAALLSVLGPSVAVGFDAVDALLDLHTVMAVATQAKQGTQVNYKDMEVSPMAQTIQDVFPVYDLVQRANKFDITALAAAVESLRASSRELWDLTGAEVSLTTISDEALTNVAGQVQVWRDHIDLWKEWSLLQHTFTALKDAGLSVVVEALQEGEIDLAHLEDIGKASLSYGLIKLFTQTSPELSNFSRLIVEGKIDEYNTLIGEVESLCQEQIVHTLLDAIPSPLTWTEEESLQLAQINRAIQSKGRGVSIRELFNNNAQVMRKLLPCMLMSPLSVAQYIDLEYPKFDLVIFDEASQIRTGTAVGAMSRAENVIIVGDPKQMPPTNFFNGNKVDEDNVHVEDLESLLEDCLAVSMPQRYLSCHYRSQSESLIAFSNMNYYDSKMMTFPAPTDLVSKVTFTHIEGTYDRGATRTNEAEANAIVKAIEERLRSGDTKTTIGVITFNMTQSNLIEDKLQALLDSDKDLREAADAMSESIFVKNLENVQGDERDCIYFSITYGPDENGRVFQNYGPLGQQGGWRRLNVAVSRARKEMHIISTLQASDIAVHTKTVEGVRGLRDFIQYAQMGRLPQTVVADSQQDFLTERIAEYVKSLGYDVRTNVGTSQFKIPLAVVKPNSKDTFGCAILMDNTNYAKLPTMRDRNALVPGVLGRMGWPMYRIWTIDWFEDLKGEQERLRRYLAENLGDVR